MKLADELMMIVGTFIVSLKAMFWCGIFLMLVLFGGSVLIRTAGHNMTGNEHFHGTTFDCDTVPHTMLVLLQMSTFNGLVQGIEMFWSGNEHAAAVVAVGICLFNN